MKPVYTSLAIVILASLLSLPAPASAQADDPASWNSIETQCEQLGLNRRQVRRIAERCRQQDIDAAAATGMMKPAYRAAGEGVPPSAVMDKIEEGLGKGVPVEQIAQAAQRRTEYMITARNTVRSQAKAMGKGEAALVTAMALAMESGVSPDALDRVVGGADPYRAGPMQTAVAAGEMLCLSGFSMDEVEVFMQDYLQRDLRRSEALRAVRYASERRREGMAFRAIRQSLWGKGDSSGYGRSPRSQGETAGRASAEQAWGAPAEAGSGRRLIADSPETGVGGPTSTAPGPGKAGTQPGSPQEPQQGGNSIQRSQGEGR